MPDVSFRCLLEVALLGCRRRADAVTVKDIIGLLHFCETVYFVVVRYGRHPF